MRLFVAIPLGAVVRDAILQEQRRLARELDAAARQPRWATPEQMHLTMAFIGHVAEGKMEGVLAAMSSAFDQAPFEIGVGGHGVFPSHGAPRVWWLGISQGGTELAALQTRVTARLRAADIPFDEKPFHPHVTLARWRDSRPSDRRAVSRVRDAQGHTPPVLARQRVDSVSLYNSQLPSGRGAGGRGPTYTALAHVPLAC
jgi:2'-5' RNA ligase